MQAAGDGWLCACNKFCEEVRRAPALYRGLPEETGQSREVSVVQAEGQRQ